MQYLKHTSTKFVNCDCGTHQLQINKVRYPDEPSYIEFSIWHRGRGGEILSWRERLRWCFNILKTGCPWGDSVIVEDKDKIKEIIGFLNHE